MVKIGNKKMDIDKIGKMDIDKSGLKTFIIDYDEYRNGHRDKLTGKYRGTSIEDVKKRFQKLADNREMDSEDDLYYEIVDIREA